MTIIILACSNHDLTKSWKAYILGQRCHSRTYLSYSNTMKARRRFGWRVHFFPSPRLLFVRLCVHVRLCEQPIVARHLPTGSLSDWWISVFKVSLKKSIVCLCSTASSPVPPSTHGRENKSKAATMNGPRHCPIKHVFKFTGKRERMLGTGYALFSTIFNINKKKKINSLLLIIFSPL